MSHQYRVRNSVTGHEYADVDSHATARSLMLALTVTHGVAYEDLTVDGLVPATETTADGTLTEQTLSEPLRQ